MKTGVAVIGGGFAGLNLVKHLSEDENFRITLVDVNNYHLFPPLLYQVATGFLDVSNIAYTFRELFQGNKNIRVRLGKLQKVMPEDNKVFLSTGGAVLRLSRSRHRHRDQLFWHGKYPRCRIAHEDGRLSFGLLKSAAHCYFYAI